MVNRPRPASGIIAEGLARAGSELVGWRGDLVEFGPSPHPRGAAFVHTLFPCLVLEFFVFRGYSHDQGKDVCIDLVERPSSDD